VRASRQPLENTVKLYYTPGYCSLAVHIALREASVEFILEKVDPAAPGFRDINPRGYVPVLELSDGSRHTEAAALLQYVGDLASAEGLMPPAGSRARFAVLQWLTFVSSELHKQFSPWLFHKETAESTRKLVENKIAQRLAELDAHFSRNEWLAGGTFTVADAYLFAIVNWAPWVGMSLSRHPNLEVFMKRVRARPHVRAALAAEAPK
jgi:glutathione S-transferase